VLLYDNPVSGNCFKVRLLLAHLGIPYERRFVDVIDRSDPRESLASLNPARALPTLVLDDGRPLAESNAILWYFGEGTRFVPFEHFERTKVLQWQFFEQYELLPSIGIRRWLVTYSGWPRERYESRLPEYTRRGKKALAALEEGLEDRDWLVGESFSIADITLYAYTHAANEAEIPLEPYENIRAWLDRVAAEPGHVPIDAES
jgi:glutathione S-transferase